MSPKKNPSKKHLKKRLHKLVTTHYQSRKKTTLSAIKMGKAMIKYKKEIGSKQFKKTLDKEFPEITPRTRQRYMKLGQQIHLKNHSMLTHLSLSALYALASLADKQKIYQYLKEVATSINLNFDETNLREISLFREDIRKLIKNPPTVQHKIKGKESREYMNWLSICLNQNTPLSEIGILDLKEIQKILTKILNRSH